MYNSRRYGNEMDIRHFVDKLDEIYLQNNIYTRLKKLRLNGGYSQSQLAKKSGISIRTIQQYEQRAKDINKASIETINCLSKALYCNINDLMEPNIVNHK